MSLLVPKSGTVIRYSYLWQRENAEGQEEGMKPRPCVVVFTRQKDDGHTRVFVAPITHTKPFDIKVAIEVSPDVKKQLGLDWEKSWIITNEVNSFDWPGTDIRLIDSKNPARGYVYGHLAEKDAKKLYAAVYEQMTNGRAKPIKRDWNSRKAEQTHEQQQPVREWRSRAASPQPEPAPERKEWRSRDTTGIQHNAPASDLSDDQEQDR